MKKLLLLLCILVFAVSLAHELMLDAAPLSDTALSAVPVLSEAEVRRMRLRLPWMADSLTLSADGQTLPADEDGLFYTPAEQGITVTAPARARLARTAWETDVNGNTTCKIFRYDGISRSSRTLLLTELPVLDLQLIDRSSENIPIGDTGRELGLVRLFSANDAGRVQVQLEAATARVRGGSSRQYPKKSYAIAFVDEQGAPRQASLLDLPADTEYGLNSLYEDDSKIRDMLSFELWSLLEAEYHVGGAPHDALSMRYTELLIDGQYWGLYGLQQLITPAALSITEGDALYKLNGEIKTSDSLYLRIQAPEVIVNTPDGGAEELLQQAFTALEHYDTAEVPVFERSNAIHYALYLQLVCGVDNETRNMALCYRKSTDAFHMVAWDMDQTFGAYWSGKSPTYIGYDPAIAATDRLALHEWKGKPFSSLAACSPTVRDAVAKHYRDYRADLLSTESLLARADALYDLVTESGARARDAARWKDSAVSADNSFIQTFIRDRMAYLDTLYGA